MVLRSLAIPSLSWAASCSVAISVRTQTQFGSSPQSITTASGDRALVVMFSAWDSIDLTAVSFNSVSFTQGAANIDGVSGESSEVWYLLDPDITTADVAFTVSPAASDGPALTVFIVAADGTVSVVDTGADAGDPSSSTTENCAAGDLALAMGGNFGAAASVGGAYGSGDALAADQTFNGQHCRPYALTVSSGSTINATSQLTVGQIVLREAATEPVVSSLSPAADATGVATNTNPTITWDQNVDAGTGVFTITEEGLDGGVFGTFDVTNGAQVTVSGADVTILAGDFEYSRTYYITWPAGIVLADDDAAPNAAQTSQTFWRFTTETIPTPVAWLKA